MASTASPLPKPSSWRSWRLGGLILLLSAGAGAADLPKVNPKAKGSFTGVFMWHDVVQDKKLVWFDITVKALEAQFASIKKNRLTPITMDQLADHLEHGKAVPKSAVVLTFDDNDLGLYQYAWPMLKRYKWPATFFVHTGYVGKPTSKVHCTWDQLREMEKSGLIKCYPHTVTHPADLRRLKDPALEKELAGSKAAMEKELGAPRAYFCYSNGFFDRRVAEATAKAGYRLAITENPGSAESSPNLMMVHRYSMHRRSAQAIGEVARAMKR